MQNEIILEDEAVLLRPLTIDDVQHLLHFSLDEPTIWKYSLVQAGGGEAQMRNYIQHAMDGLASGKEYPFIVFDKKQQAYAGSTRFYDINTDYKTVQLGYTWYGSKFQGTGLNKHCKYLLLQYAFETWGAERVEFRADANNERSIAAMKSIGCTPEGILRNNMPTPYGGRRSSIILSILQSEWTGHVKAMLLGKLR